jgi:hypothetical protein
MSVLQFNRFMQIAASTPAVSSGIGSFLSNPSKGLAADVPRFDHYDCDVTGPAAVDRLLETGTVNWLWGHGLPVATAFRRASTAPTVLRRCR